MRTVAIIPARGGSKEVRNKNLQKVDGLELVARSIKHAHGSTLLDGVFVSTEYPPIAEVASSFGAQVIPRPMNLATDFASTDSVLVHAIEWIKEQNHFPELLVLLQPTSPFRPPKLIDDCIERIRVESADSLITVNDGPHFVWFEQEQRTLKSNVPFDRKVRPLRQDMRTVDVPLFENGNVNVCRTDLLLSSGCRIGRKLVLHRMPREYGLEVDSEYDLFIARKMTDYLHEQGKKHYSVSME